MAPNIFTETPIEGALLTFGIQGQMALGLALGSVAALKTLMLIPTCWAFIKAVTGVSAGNGHPAGHSANLVGKLLTVLFATAALTTPSGDIPISSPEGSQWKTYPGVINSSNDTIKRLGNSNEGLLFYSLIHGSISEAGAFATEIIDKALSSTRFVKDPGFFIETLARAGGKAMGSFGAGVTNSLDHLTQNCQNGSRPRVLGPSRNLKDVFDLSTPECQGLWNQFNQEYEKMGQIVETIYGDRELDALGKDTLPNGSSMKDVAVNKARSDLILRYMRDKAGYSSSGTSTEMRDVTFSNNKDTLLEDVARHGLLSNGYIKLLGYFSDIEGDLLKAESANNFRKYGSHIPAARGMIFMILALAFPIIITLAGFSLWKPFFGWVLATITLTLYQPLSVASFRIVELLRRQSSFVESLNLVSSDPLSFSGFQLLQSEMNRIETVYLWSQIGLFTTLVASSIFVFLKVDSMVSAHAGKQIFGDTLNTLRWAGFTNKALTGGASLGNQNGMAFNVNAKSNRNSPPQASPGIIPSSGPLTPNPSGNGSGSGGFAMSHRFSQLSAGLTGASQGLVRSSASSQVQDRNTAPNEKFSGPVVAVAQKQLLLNTSRSTDGAESI